MVKSISVIPNVGILRLLLTIAEEYVIVPF